jgi:hypothetical protein
MVAATPVFLLKVVVTLEMWKRGWKESDEQAQATDVQILPKHGTAIPAK